LLKELKSQNKITRENEIQFLEEELSGGKWALTDRWTLWNWTSRDEEGLDADLTINLNLHLNPNLDLTCSWI